MNDTLKKYASLLKNPKILVAAGIIGIVLIALSTFIGPSNKKETEKQTVGTTVSADEYRERLEEDVADMVESITGSESVTVMITLESGVRYTYADATEGTSASKTESNSDSSSSETTKQTYITVKNADGGEEALLVTELMPEVRGVAVICDGGDDETVAEKVRNAVTAALNITSKRVYIAGGTTYEKR